MKVPIKLPSSRASPIHQGFAVLCKNSSAEDHVGTMNFEYKEEYYGMETNNAAMRSVWRKDNETPDSDAVSFASTDLYHCLC
jgi:hypothetical protein